jgi:GNAT superfamily N-acetyltransferase
MYHFLQISSPDERYLSPPGLPALSAELIARQHPDALWLLTEPAGVVAARCALWWKATPPFEDHHLGLIGHYAARDATAAGSLLLRAIEQLAIHGCTLAAGPMDGNTWQRYRLLTERGSEPTFFLEPDNPDDWPDHWRAAGFTALADYYSALSTNLADEDPRIPELARRLETAGAALRPLRLDEFDAELRRIHSLALASFAHNFLYTPISQDDFLTQYRVVRPFVQPELVIVAERQQQTIGFAFAVPDLCQAQRGQRVDTMILKTLAVHPHAGGFGLGSVLTARCHEAARRLGYTRAIHALMHATNKSRRISGHTARTIRRYTLFARPLADARLAPSQGSSPEGTP